MSSHSFILAIYYLFIHPQKHKHLLHLPIHPQEHKNLLYPLYPPRAFSIMLTRLFSSAKQPNSPTAETSTASCSISLVQGEKDFKILGPTIFKATQERKVEAILFSRGKPGAEDAEKGQIGFSVWAKDQDLTSRSWKASALNDKKNMVGISTISYQEGEIQEYQPPDPVSYKHKPSTLRVDFLIYMNGEYNRLRRKHINGLKHVSKYAILLPPVNCSLKATL